MYRIEVVGQMQVCGFSWGSTQSAFVLDAGLPDSSGSLATDCRPVLVITMRMDLLCLYIWTLAILFLGHLHYYAFTLQACKIWNFNKMGSDWLWVFFYIHMSTLKWVKLGVKQLILTSVRFNNYSYSHIDDLFNTRTAKGNWTQREEKLPQPTFLLLFS